MRVLGLFSGIGGFELGLERAGMQVVALCEIEPYCRKVLRGHWPSVPIFEDVRELSSQHLTAAGLGVDLICGGFPCQDISDAGKRVGIAGDRSGLWREYARLIDEIRPRWAIIENVLGLRARGLDTVLRSLHALGYDAEWHCIPASAVGGWHRRDRIWIVAYPSVARSHAATQTGLHSADAREGARDGEPQRLHSARMEGVVAVPKPEPLVELKLSCEWDTEPAVARMVDGLPRELAAAEIGALGNAVVPRIPQLIGKAIMSLQPSI